MKRFPLRGGFLAATLGLCLLGAQPGHAANITGGLALSPNAANATLPDARHNLLYTPATCDGFSASDGAITASSTTFTSASAAFASGDVGKPISIRKAGGNYFASAATLNAGGASHAVGDTITFTGGLQVYVRAISGGGATGPMTSFYVVESADSTSAPATLSQTATTGVGTGAVLNTTWLHKNLVTTIAAVIDAHTVTLTGAAAATVSDVLWGYGTDHGAEIQAAIDSGETVHNPLGICASTVKLTFGDRSVIRGHGIGLSAGQSPSTLMYVGPHDTQGRQLSADSNLNGVSQARLSGAHVGGFELLGLGSIGHGYYVAGVALSHTYPIKTVGHIQFGVELNGNSSHDSIMDVYEQYRIDESLADLNTHGLAMGFPNSVNTGNDPDLGYYGPISITTNIAGTGVPYICGVADHNTFIYMRNRGSASVPGVDLLGGQWNTGNGNCRDNHWLGMDAGDGGGFSRAIGFLTAARNTVEFYDMANGSPAFVTETGASSDSTDNLGRHEWLKLRLKTYATLPTPVDGLFAYITDANVSNVGDIVSSGGGTLNVFLVYRNGAWHVLSSAAQTLVNLKVSSFANRDPSPVNGSMAGINDASTGVFGATIAGGGTFSVVAVYNGADWRVVAPLGGLTQTPALTGDVTKPEGSSTATTIAANAVTNAKAAQMANGTIKCRTTAGTGNPEDCTTLPTATKLSATAFDSDRFLSKSDNTIGLKQDAKSYGAACDVVSGIDGSMTSGSAVLTSAGSTFPASAIGKRVVVPGAGAAPFSVLENSSAIAVPGTGYTANDVLTAVGGTSTVPFTVQIITAGGGIPSAFAILNAGVYTVLPSNPVSFTGGSGINFTLTAQFVGSPLYGTISSASGGSTATLSVTASNTISGSARWYYGTDDATALQAAFNAAKTTGAAPGQIVVPGAGCGTTAQLELPVVSSASTVIGQGEIWGANQAQSVIYAFAPMTSVLHRSNTFGWYGGARNLRVEANYLADYGLYIEGSTSSNYRDVFVENAKISGYKFGNGSDAVTQVNGDHLDYRTNPNIFSQAQLPTHGLWLVNGSLTDSAFYFPTITGVLTNGILAGGAGNHIISPHVYGSPGPGYCPTYGMQFNARSTAADGHIDCAKTAGIYITAGNVSVSDIMMNLFTGLPNAYGVEIASGVCNSSVSGVSAVSTSMRGAKQVQQDGTPCVSTSVQNNAGATYSAPGSAGLVTNGFTVGTLPTGAAGMRAHVTDQLTACVAVGAALTGGGAVTCPVFYNGAAWVGG